MNKRNGSGLVGLIAVAMLAAPALPLAQAKDSPFKLAAAVPNDVFICVSARPNPERDFLDAYWGEVWEAFEASGVSKDVMSLIASLMSEGQQAEMDSLMERATKLIDGVDWDQLGGEEFLFAQRMPVAQQTWSEFILGPPDMLFLLRGTGDGAAKNFEGLTAILEAMVEEINKLAGDQVLTVERGERGGAKVASMTVPGRSFSLDVAVHGKVIAIALGESILDDSLALLSGKDGKKALAADPRFQAAQKALPTAEDATFFFDVQALLSAMRNLADQGMKFAASQQHSGTTNSGQSPEASALNQQAVGAYREGDHAKALELIKKANQIEPKDSKIMYNLACFHALAGSKDEALSWLEKAVDGGFTDPHQISSDSDLVTLHDDPRYEAAVAKASQPPADGQGADNQWLTTIQALIDRALDIPGMVDYIASVEYTEGYATHTETVIVLAPGAASKPFYAVVGKRQPLTEFDRYIPAEAASFAVGSGIDLAALYTFLVDTAQAAGPEGEKLLAEWAAVQQQLEIDVAKDWIGWIDGRTVVVSMGRGMAATRVLMLKVTDEARAREKVGGALEALSTMMKQAAAGNPLLAMYAPRTAPLTDERLEGFQSVTLAMQPMVWGVADGWLIAGTSADAVVTCLETAAGKHPNIRTNERVMSEALLPKGPFTSVTFTDERDFGQGLSMALGMMTMSGMILPMVIPDEDARKVVGKIIGIIGKLAPVAAKIDFYKSTAAYMTFDGQAWHARQVTHYQSPAERSADATP